MFKGKSKSEFFAETSGNNAASLISAGTTLTGDINSNADLRIDGTLVGNINSTAKVIIGANGTVKGDINGQQADILGKVIGAVKVKELLQLKGNSVVQGNIQAGKLQVEPTATFNGECHMELLAAEKANAKADSKASDKFNAAPVQ
ncbi:MAG: polymer-forming cytoskeletal protein [Bacteroidota bacterium]|nr:polymer-forming cytoskeletal protein [Bacteroidota bacterium]